MDAAIAALGRENAARIGFVLALPFAAGDPSSYDAETPPVAKAHPDSKISFVARRRQPEPHDRGVGALGLEDPSDALTQKFTAAAGKHRLRAGRRGLRRK